MLASDPIDEVRRILLDEAAVAYSSGDLIMFLNEALEATTDVKKDLYTINGAIPLVAGIIQELPSDGVELFNITHNQDSGRSCTEVDLDLLQETNRFWTIEDATVYAENWAFDTRSPRRFYVTPPNTGGSGVALIGVYGAVHPAITDATDALQISAENRHLLVNWMLARCYSISSKRYDPTKEAYYMNEWKQGVGLKSAAQIAAAPKLEQRPGK